MATSNRRQPQRSVRHSAQRRGSYYARPPVYRDPFGLQSMNEPAAPAPSPGFFPGIQHFADAIAALPKEVMRHFTLLKETEGKAYQPDLAITDLANAILQLPQPLRNQSQSNDAALLGLSLANSVSGSVNGSVTDGSANYQTAVPQEGGWQSGPADETAEKRHSLFADLQTRLREMIMVLDEKNMVLSSANETLTRQLDRLDSAMPTIESEISEEARLGSNDHWALAHIRELRKGNTASSNDRSRRDVQAANSLAAAAAAVHEGDIAATRSEARREALAAKHRRTQNADSDFDERPAPKRTYPSKQARRMQMIQDMGLNAEGKAREGSLVALPPSKRRRVDKAASTERSMSAALNGKLSGAKDASHSRDADGVRKRPKPLPAQAAARKKIVANSPSIASSPTRGTFPTATRRESSPPANAQRVASSRARQNSAQLTSQDASRNKPAASYGVGKGMNGATGGSNAIAGADARSAAERLPSSTDIGASGPPAAVEQQPDNVRSLNAGTANNLKREEIEPAEGEQDVSLNQQQQVRRARETGKASKPATPDDDRPGQPTAVAAPPMSRSRSNRAPHATAAAASSPAAASPRRTHKRGASAGNMADPRDSSASSAEEALAKSGNGASNAAAAAAAAAVAAGGPAAEHTSTSQRPSRRANKAAALPAATTASSEADASDADEARGRRAARGAAKPSHTHLATGADNETATASRAPADDANERAALAAGAAASADADAGAGPDADADADDAPELELEDDEDDENEPRYCICGDFSYGDMIACDNDACPREWFHLQCVGLARAPSSKTKWYCEECRAKMRREGRLGAGAGGGGGSAGMAAGGGNGGASGR